MSLMVSPTKHKYFERPGMLKSDPEPLPPMRPLPVGRVLEPVARGRDIQAEINAGIEAMQASAPAGHTLKLGWEVRDPDLTLTYTPPEYTADELVFAHCVHLNHKKYQKPGKAKTGPGPITHKICPAQKQAGRIAHARLTARANYIK